MITVFNAAGNIFRKIESNKNILLCKIVTKVGKLQNIFQKSAVADLYPIIFVGL